MSLFVVDTEKCSGEGACVAECPVGIIEIKEQFPIPVDRADELCINCGHCVAVCPHDALALRNMTPEQCPPVRREWLLDAERVEHFLRARRSIRAYRDKPVARETLIKLIEIARFAPSGSNAQPVSWLVIHDSDEVRRLAGLAIDWMRNLLKERPQGSVGARRLNQIVAAWEEGTDIICRGAPHVIVAHGSKDNPAARVDCTIALTYLELAVPSFGLGACWAGYFNAAANLWPPMQEALELPKGHISCGAMMVGYPRYRYYRLPLRNEPRITWR